MAHYRTRIDTTPGNHSRMTFQLIELHDDLPSSASLPRMKEANTADLIHSREQYFLRRNAEELSDTLHCLRIPETFKALTHF